MSTVQMRTVLIVDDTAVAREPLAKLLRYEGYETACAANGVEALAAVQARPVDVILLDVMMPKMDGLKFLEVLRRGQAGTKSQGVPVILLTGTMDPRHLARARELEVRTIFTKARFTMEELSASLRACLPAA